MRKVTRAEIVDFATYGDLREEFRARVMESKRTRRVHLGDCLTFLFENTETVRYQVQEMMRVERIVREADIAHELATYNDLLGGDGELGCTLLVEIDDEQERDRQLRALRGLPGHIYLRCAPVAGETEERKIHARFDGAQIGDEKLSSVQYLKFTVGDAMPIAIGSDLPALCLEAALSDEQRACLLDDLRRG